MVRIIAVFLFATITPVAAQSYDPTGFSDCILEHSPGAMSDHAADDIRNACARKHETNTDGQEKNPVEARTSSPPAQTGLEVEKWSQVTSSQDFISANKEVRDLMRRKYLEWVVVPGTPKGVAPGEIREKFMEATEADVERGRF